MTWLLLARSLGPVDEHHKIVGISNGQEHHAPRLAFIVAELAQRMRSKGPATDDSTRCDGVTVRTVEVSCVVNSAHTKRYATSTFSDGFTEG